MGNEKVTRDEELSFYNFCDVCRANCCKNMVVFFTEAEIERLNLTREQITKNFVECVGKYKGNPLKYRLIKKQENGYCGFFSEQDNCCSIYEKRSLDCRIYPFLLDYDFSNETLHVFMHTDQKCGEILMENEEWKAKTLEYLKEEIKSWNIHDMMVFMTLPPDFERDDEPSIVTKVAEFKLKCKS